MDLMSFTPAGRFNPKTAPGSPPSTKAPLPQHPFQDHPLLGAPMGDQFLLQSESQGPTSRPRPFNLPSPHFGLLGLRKKRNQYVQDAIERWQQSLLQAKSYLDDKTPLPGSQDFSEWTEAMFREGKDQHVSPTLLLAMADEFKWNPLYKSDRGERFGLLQVPYSWALEKSKENTPEFLLRPTNNIHWAAHRLGEAKRQLKIERFALMAYLSNPVDTINYLRSPSVLTPRQRETMAQVEATVDSLMTRKKLVEEGLLHQKWKEKKKTALPLEERLQEVFPSSAVLPPRLLKQIAQSMEGDASQTQLALQILQHLPLKETRVNETTVFNVLTLKKKMGDLLQRYGGDERLALVALQVGSDVLEQFLLSSYSYSKQYPKHVQAIERAFSQADSFLEKTQRLESTLPFPLLYPGPKTLKERLIDHQENILFLGLALLGFGISHGLLNLAQDHGMIPSPHPLSPDTGVDTHGGSGGPFLTPTPSPGSDNAFLESALLGTPFPTVGPQSSHGLPADYWLPPDPHEFRAGPQHPSQPDAVLPSSQPNPTVGATDTSHWIDTLYPAQDFNHWMDNLTDIEEPGKTTPRQQADLAQVLSPFKDHPITYHLIETAENQGWKFMVVGWQPIPGRFAAVDSVHHHILIHPSLLHPQNQQNPEALGDVVSSLMEATSLDPEGNHLPAPDLMTQRFLDTLGPTLAQAALNPDALKDVTSQKELKETVLQQLEQTAPGMAPAFDRPLDQGNHWDTQLNSYTGYRAYWQAMGLGPAINAIQNEIKGTEAAQKLSTPISWTMPAVDMVDDRFWTVPSAPNSPDVQGSSHTIMGSDLPNMSATERLQWAARWALEAYGEDHRNQAILAYVQAIFEANLRNDPSELAQRGNLLGLKDDPAFRNDDTFRTQPLGEGGSYVPGINPPPQQISEIDQGHRFKRPAGWFESFVNPETSFEFQRVRYGYSLEAIDWWQKLQAGQVQASDIPPEYQALMSNPRMWDNYEKIWRATTPEEAFRAVQEAPHPYAEEGSFYSDSLAKIWTDPHPALGGLTPQQIFESVEQGHSTPPTITHAGTDTHGGTAVSVTPPSAPEVTSPPAIVASGPTGSAPFVVVLDPGHGGEDSGATGQLNGTMVKEADINLQVAKELKVALESLGITVHMTRDTDVLVPLEDISAFTRKVNPNLFISIHVNSAENTSAQGIETYFYDDEEAFAREVQTALIAQTGAVDRGVKSASFHVIREIPGIDGILVENGFISNGDEVGQLVSDARENQVVKAIAESVAKHFGLDPASIHYAPADDGSGIVAPPPVTTPIQDLPELKTTRWRASTGIEGFIEAAYLNTHGGVDANGVKTWAEVWKTKGLAAVVEGFMMSADIRNHYTAEQQADLIYRMVLLRDADDGARAQVADALRRGQTVSSIVNQMIAQEEFQDNLADHRVPSPAPTVVPTVQPGGPPPTSPQVVVHPLPPLKVTHWKANSGIAGFVEAAYINTHGGVDRDGVKMWTQVWETKGFPAVVEGFLNSTEIKAKYTAEQRADLLYRMVFLRDGDADGRAQVADALRKGVSVQTLVRGMIPSAEFQEDLTQHRVPNPNPTQMSNTALVLAPIQSILDSIQTGPSLGQMTQQVETHTDTILSAHPNLQAPLALALSQVGASEAQHNLSYISPRIENGEEWCEFFVNWVFDKTFSGGRPWANHPTDKTLTDQIAQWGQSQGVYHPMTHNYRFPSVNDLPTPGSITYIDYNGDGRGDHTGIVVSVESRPTGNGSEVELLSIQTVDGNWSSSVDLGKWGGDGYYSRDVVKGWTDMAQYAERGAIPPMVGNSNPEPSALTTNSDGAGGENLGTIAPGSTLSTDTNAAQRLAEHRLRERLDQSIFTRSIDNLVFANPHGEESTYLQRSQLVQTLMPMERHRLTENLLFEIKRNNLHLLVSEYHPDGTAVTLDQTHHQILIHPDLLKPERYDELFAGLINALAVAKGAPELTKDAAASRYSAFAGAALAYLMYHPDTRYQDLPDSLLKYFDKPLQQMGLGFTASGDSSLKAYTQVIRQLQLEPMFVKLLWNLGQERLEQISPDRSTQWIFSQPMGETFPYASALPGHFQYNTGLTKNNITSPIPEFTITSGFGTSRGDHAHTGIDLVSKTDDQTIYAPMDGIVIQFPFDGDGYGNYVILYNNGLMTYFAHMGSVHVKNGQVIQAGTPMGTIGATGWADGAHLHFEVREVDPNNLGSVNPFEWGKPINPAFIFNR